MKLEEATAVLRPRSAWEAVDLGCALARRHWGKLMRGWLTVALPLWAIIAVLCRDHPGWAMFWIWWTKPVLTRQPVWFMSRALFGPPPRAREFWRDWKIALCRGLFAALTFKRFAFQRSFRLSVITLEGQSGRAYTKRAAILSAHGGSSASWLTYVSMKLEMVVAIGLTFYLNTFLPEGVEEWMDTGLGAASAMPEWFLWASNLFYVMAIALIEPMYGAAGFALYINSRTHLEGWDIEVAFRRMSNRLTLALTAAVTVILSFATLTENASAKPSRLDPKAVAEEIKKDPDFELEKRKVPIEQPEENEPPKPERSRDSTGSGGSGGDMRWIGFVLIGAVVVIAALLIWKNRSALRRGKSGDSTPRTGPRVVMGMDLAPESLPEDIPQAAWREYQAGRPAVAMRLLYRGALAWLVDRASLPVHESDTEGDCLRHTRQLGDPVRGPFFESLTIAWINCAYAEIPPDAVPMKQLCDQWPFSLRQRAAAAPVAATSAAWLLVPFVAMLLSGCGDNKGADVKWEEKIVGYKGQAKANPWLAAQRTLEKLGTPTTLRTSLGTMPDTSTALFIPLDSVNSRGAARQMIQWAARGGHLIVACGGTDRFRNDWHDYGSRRDGNDEEWQNREEWRSRDEPGSSGGHPLLEELNVAFQSSGGDLGGSVDFGDGDKLSFASHTDSALDVHRFYTDVVAGDEKSTALATGSYGGGRITLLASATPFRNRWLDQEDQDHAAILHTLVHLEYANSVLFIGSSRVNLMAMLMENAWMPLIAIVLLIALWLWRHLPRFGPAIPADNTSVRHFGTQLDEAGAFLSDRAVPGSLLAPARKSILQAAARSGLSPDAPDFIEQLAARSGLPASAVRQALTDLSDKADIITAAAHLQTLRQCLT